MKSSKDSRTLHFCSNKKKTGSGFDALERHAFECVCAWIKFWKTNRKICTGKKGIVRVLRLECPLHLPTLSSSVAPLYFRNLYSHFHRNETRIIYIEIVIFQLLDWTGKKSIDLKTNWSTRFNKGEKNLDLYFRMPSRKSFLCMSSQRM